MIDIMANRQTGNVLHVTQIDWFDMSYQSRLIQSYNSIVFIYNCTLYFHCTLNYYYLFVYFYVLFRVQVLQETKKKKKEKAILWNLQRVKHCTMEKEFSIVVKQLLVYKDVVSLGLALSNYYHYYIVIFQLSLFLSIPRNSMLFLHFFSQSLDFRFGKLCRI